MKIESMEIKNYKSCTNTKIEINPRMTTLIGVNGSGKTTILSAIKLLRDAVTDSRHYFDIDTDNLIETEVNAVFVNLGEKIFLKSKISYDVGSRSNEEIVDIQTSWRIPSIFPRKWVDIPVEFLSFGSIKNYENALKRGRLIGKNSMHKFLSEKERIPSQFIEKLFEVVIFIKKINYYSATQFSDPTKSPTSIELEDRDNFTYRTPRKGNSHLNYIADLYKLKKENPDEFARYINLIGPDGVGLVENIEFDEVNFSAEEVSVKSGGKIITSRRVKAIVVPKVSIDDKILSFNQLSEGTLKTVSLLFYILQSDNTLLLIEEPEVCVHHGLLNSIIEVIKSVSREKQIIVTTHSDFVLDKLKPEDLIIISKTKGIGTVATKLSKVLSKNSFKALHEYLKESGNLGEYWKEGGFDE